MRRLFLTLIAVAIAAAATLQCAALDFVIVQDPTSIPKAHIGLKAVEDLVYDLKVPPGTRVVHLLALGTRCETIANVTVPTLATDSLLGQKFKLAGSLKQSEGRLARTLESGIPTGSSGILLPAVLAHLRDLGLSGAEVSVLVEGSPFVVVSSPALDLNRFYPQDGVIDLAPEVNRLGMSHLRSAFKNLTITWHLPFHPMPIENQRRLQRYLTLAASYSGASLVNWTTDREAAVRSFVSPAGYKAEEFTRRPEEPARLVCHLLKPLKTGDLATNLVAAIEELRKAGVTACVAAGWRANSDIDVHLDTKQFPNEGEVFYGRTNTAHLNFRGDRTKATGTATGSVSGFEIVTLDEAIRPDLLKLWLNLYQSSEPATGEVVLFKEDRLFRMTFAFDPKDRGDGGKNRAARVGANNWIEIRIPDLLNHPVEE